MVCKWFATMENEENESSSMLHPTLTQLKQGFYGGLQAAHASLLQYSTRVLHSTAPLLCLPRASRLAPFLWPLLRNPPSSKPPPYMHGWKQQAHLDMHFFSHAGEFKPVLQGQHTAELHLLYLAISCLVGLHSCGPIRPKLGQGSSLSIKTDTAANMGGYKKEPVQELAVFDGQDVLLKGSLGIRWRQNRNGIWRRCSCSCECHACMIQVLCAGYVTSTMAAHA